MSCGRHIGPFECCSVVRGDSYELLPRVPAQSFDAVITDPPYGIGIAYWDEEPPYGVLSDFLRITAGPILWFGSGTRIVQDAGRFPKTPKRVLIWAPSFSNCNASGSGLAYRYHPIYAWNLPKRCRTPLWSDVLRNHTESGCWWDFHCTKPLALMRDLCQIVPAGSTILDPFAGSGTTCVAAKQNGQHFLGFERDEQPYSIAVERLRCISAKCFEEVAA